MARETTDGPTFTKELPIKITEEERNTKAREAAALRVDAAVIEAEIKAYAKPRNEKLAELRTTIDALSRAATTGEVLADVQCVERKDWRRGEVSCVRLDTNEIYEGPRAMTPKESQREEFTDDDGSPPNKRRAKLTSVPSQH